MKSSAKANQVIHCAMSSIYACDLLKLGKKAGIENAIRNMNPKNVSIFSFTLIIKKLSFSSWSALKFHSLAYRVLRL